MSGSENLFGKLTPLSSTVDYQKDAIVSRTLVRNPSGHVVLFAFDAGQELSEHTSPYEVMVLAVEGEADFVLSGQTFRMKAGDMILMPPNAPHSLKTVTPFKTLLVMLRGGED
ncbi:MAG: cupin domain-containing protein [Candidatus Fervidibacter sp.]|uniref:cupin domain-containing protein n=1 Tax=Candidatus Fervidibacter sp. TaxID=3100871 RepID=UPI00404A69BC